MMRSLVLVLAIGIIAVPGVFQATRASAGNTETPGQPAPDNTKQNVRDRDGTTLTPMDQGSSEADRTITQQIRKAVVGHDGLSTDAKNVKIITQDGVVTLRGPVKSAEEKATIAALSTKTEGVKHVDNELEVAAQR